MLTPYGCTQLLMTPALAFRITRILFKMGLHRRQLLNGFAGKEMASFNQRLYLVPNFVFVFNPAVVAKAIEASRNKWIAALLLAKRCDPCRCTGFPCACRCTTSEAFEDFRVVAFSSTLGCTIMVQ